MVTLTPAQLRCLMVGPWLDGTMSLNTTPIEVDQQEDDGWIYADFHPEDKEEGSGVLIDPGGCMYASGPSRDNPNEDTCSNEVTVNPPNVSLSKTPIIRLVISRR